MLDPGDGGLPAKQRTRVSHSTHATAGRIVALIAMAAAAWTGCNLVPQTLPPDNGLASSVPAASETDGGLLVLADASVGASSSGGEFGTGGSGGSGNGGPSTVSGGGDAAATFAPPAPDAGAGATEADASVAAEAGSATDAGAIGNPVLDGAPGDAEPDATPGAFPDGGDNFNDASPADASDDVSLE